MKSLTKQQILQGIEDLVINKLRPWKSTVVVVDRGIAGMIIGTPEFVEMMKSAAQGKTTLPLTKLN